MQKRRHEIDIHKDMLRAQIKSSEEERQTVRYSSGGRTGEGTWKPVSLGGYSGVWGKVFLSNVRQPGGEPFSILNSRMPKVIQRVFVMGFDMQMCHSLTLSWQRSALQLRSELAARHSSLLPKGVWVVHALTHPRERTLPNIAKSPLPVVVSPSKTSLLKLAIYWVLWLSLWEKTRETKLYQWNDKNRSWEHGRLKKTE